MTLPALFALRSIGRMDRREFLSWSVAGGCALTLAARPNESTKPLSPWITLHADGKVTLVSTSLEMGQGSRTGQAQILADELDVPWQDVRVVLAPEQDPYLVDGALFSGGSETDVRAFSYSYSWNRNEGIVRVHSFVGTNGQVEITLFCYEHRR